MLRSGIVCIRRSSIFGFGARSTSVEVKLSSETESILMWRNKDSSETANSWYEIDMTEMKTIERKGLHLKVKIFISSICTLF